MEIECTNYTGTAASATWLSLFPNGSKLLTHFCSRFRKLQSDPFTSSGLFQESNIVGTELVQQLDGEHLFLMSAELVVFVTVVFHELSKLDIAWKILKKLASSRQDVIFGGSNACGKALCF